MCQNISSTVFKTGKNTHLYQHAGKEYIVYLWESYFHPVLIELVYHWAEGFAFLLRFSLFGTQICLFSLLSTWLVKNLCYFLEKVKRDNEALPRLCSSKTAFLLCPLLSSGSASPCGGLFLTFITCFTGDTGGKRYFRLVFMPHCEILLEYLQNAII